jgi:CHAD domain-containing protein
MRELLPLVADSLTPAELEQLGYVLKRATRRLGRARDLDVQLQLLASLEPALPVAAGEMGRLRFAWQAERERRVRRAIKALERLDLERTLTDARRSLSDSRGTLFGRRRHLSAGPRWEHALVARLRERAGDLSEALHRAGGVLFPNRLHGARVALKKLRYAMEIATETGRADFEGQLGPIRKSQELLGRIHDHDVLAAALEQGRFSARRLLPLVEMHRRRLHERYLRRRATLLEICRGASVSATRDRRSSAAKRALLVASVPIAALALPLARRARIA